MTHHKHHHHKKHHHHHKEEKKNPIESQDSWEGHLQRKKAKHGGHHHQRRQLKHHHAMSAKEMEIEAEKNYWKQQEKDYEAQKNLRKKEREQRKEEMQSLWQDPGIDRGTTHGLMIDAGSTGCRLHVYEWEPRNLYTEQDVEDAVSGNKLSFPGTESRWTERLQPGLSTFSTYPDDKLRDAIAEYLKPLMDFSKTILHSKASQFQDFPIYLRATAGMRELHSEDRGRIMKVVRDLFNNKTYCPYAFENERARVLSGEEEAAYDWAGVNFVMGNLIDNSQGVGTVVNPKKTHGALDLGGGSTQIAFYEQNEDIMANLFKLNIGQAKHWNIYGHSFLLYGINAAMDRFHGLLADGQKSKDRIKKGIYNPCLPGGTEMQVRTDVHFEHGIETWNYTMEYPSGDGSYEALLVNPNATADVDLCLATVKELLHLGKNDWCEFAHLGDCSFAGIYQAKLPLQQTNFEEFLAFSAYYHVWKFLRLPERATIAELESATRKVCSMSADETLEWSKGKETKGDLNSYCFRSAYVYHLLHTGYGFQDSDAIRAVKVLDGQKVGWALGAMLYEINTLPWTNLYRHPRAEIAEPNKEGLFLAWRTVVFILVVVCALSAIVAILKRRRSFRHKYQGYESVADVSMHEKK